MELPKDIDDLFIAPVAIAIDEEIEHYSGLSRDEIELKIAVSTNRQPTDVDARRDAVLEALTKFVPLHNCVPTWDPRGLRLTNDGRAVVLGLPRELADYVEL